MLSSHHGQCTHSRQVRSLLAQHIPRQAAWRCAPCQKSHSRKAVLVQAGPSLAKVPKTRDGQLPVLFRLKRQYKPGERVGVVGNIAELSSWNPNAVSVLLNWVVDDAMWGGWACLPVGQELEFKFVLVDEKNDKVVKWWINDVVGDVNLKLKVEVGTVLEVGDVHIEVHPDKRRGYDSDDVADEWDGTEQGQAEMIDALNKKIAKQQEQLAKLLRTKQTRSAR